ncbi:MAG: 30S ribosomal protein S13 [Candidatus Levybacteria bacterium CG_4_10_14_0_2_um_filter_36_16]|nr:MAG: 30S ribosomal protein S13 [Candidatus Levybacteria bacterium CG2_30_37_29]PIR79312.1 MAG: 30S ribosomal protein S13 [Candidatus Levybacteria bacterium CG10_big_fil_rev_8_21_14_0_10_36_30]PIZ97109.1 MAG: 30S ribosomal protein S13 [Candidatus Levybacteria bacterium CG_4_10_14_0_2_um_filter_36_16]PJA90596.1 MAG: 30S ribosomal protein S13 [Candidatus Levybacteria bacterium CG_4_9_14_3_um_filter_36_7]
MMRIVGVNIPDSKRIDIALTYIYGIGRTNVGIVLKKAQIESTKRAKDLSEEELGRIQKALEPYKIEGELRADIANDIKRLKEIGTYRGSRHAKSLPVRGQRTRSNARTKRGKRVTIGAIKKEVAAKIETASAAKK